MLWCAALLALVAVLVTAAKATQNTKHRSEEERDVARQVYFRARNHFLERNPDENDVLHQAVLLWKEDYGWDSSDAALRQFIARWAHDTRPAPLTDRSRDIRRSPMSDAECEKCIEEIRRGHWEGEQLFGFHTLDAAANHTGPDGKPTCPTVHECRQRYHSSSSHGMFDRLKDFDSDLTHFLERPADPLTPKLKNRRVRESRTLLSQGLERRKRTFYIDAKTLLVRPEAHQVIGYKEDMEKFGHPSESGAEWRGIVGQKKTVIKIQFYCMVNWYGGVCGLWICQGSTGVAPVYMVSDLWLCAENLGGLVGRAAVGHCIPQCCSPALNVVVRVNAQHAVPRRRRCLIELVIRCRLLLPIRHGLATVCHSIHLNAKPVL